MAKGMPHRVLDVNPSVEGSEDVIYRPAPGLVPPNQFLPNPQFVRILDQGTEGACVGFGLAAVINYMSSEQGKEVRVSPRMLYEMARRYDEWPGEDYEGSSCRGAVIGWQKHGVCPESVWPYVPRERSTLTEERAKAAMQIRPTGCARVLKDVHTLRCAVYEYHAVFASGLVHKGWQHPRRGIIPFLKEEAMGGQAFAILGYTPEGFLVQNSWGMGWGGIEIDGRSFPGMALWTNEDVLENYSDGWVARLEGAPVQHRPRRPGYRSDTLDTDDFLGISADVRTICAVLTACDVKPPLSLGLFGDWGSGKSFFMDRMHKEVERLCESARRNPDASEYCQDVVQIRFNAWHYLDANLWASLVSEIFNQLFERITGPREGHDAARRRILKELGEAKGLYRQSQAELEFCERERAAARDALEERSADVRDHRMNLEELGNHLNKLLEDRPELKADLDRLSEQLGLDEAARSLDELRREVNALRTLRGKMVEVWRAIFRGKGRWRRLGWLVVLACGAAGAGALIRRLGGAEATGRLVNEYSGLAFGCASWLASASTWALRKLNAFERLAEDVDQVSEERVRELTAGERKALAVSEQAEAEARQRLERAEDRIRALNADLREVHPTRQVCRFIEERCAAEDYRKQLGLISLVRRDFEKLSDLLARSEQLEERLRNRRLERAAARAKSAPSDAPDGAVAEQQRAERESAPRERESRRRRMPVQRIILYIDDLDRCRPDRVVEVLEAVHLLLAFRLFVVVVAVDPRWLRCCLEAHYPRLLGGDGRDSENGDVGRGEEEAHGRPSTPQDYLEKIFQIPFYLRPIESVGFGNLIHGLTASDVEHLQGTGDDPAPGGKSGGEGKGTDGKRAPGGAALNASTSGQPQGMSGAKSAPADSPPEVKTEQLKFKSWELEDMKRLSPLFRTPRSAKRFVNTYRLLRVGVPAEKLRDFEGSGASAGDYRIAQVLLAVMAGYPSIAPEFLRRLLRAARRRENWESFRVTLLGPGQPAAKSPARRKPTGSRRGGASAESASAPKERSGKAVAIGSVHEGVPHSEWRQLHDALAELPKDFLPARLSEYVEHCIRAARFAFSMSLPPGNS
jgi:hypothetical protein